MVDETGILADAELEDNIKIAISPYRRKQEDLDDAGFTIYNKEQLSDIVL